MAPWFSGLCASVPAALLGSLAMGGTYVACLYIRAGYRRAGGRAPDRDDPRVIKQRFGRVGIACAIAPCISIAASRVGPSAPACVALVGAQSPSIWRWFGLAAPNVLLGTALPLSLTAVLFLGPLVMSWLERDRVTPLRDQLLARLRDLESEPLPVLRNLVIGPLSEEWVFRACMCPLLFGAGLSDVANVFFTAFVFGCAHVHHIFDSDVSHMVVLVQFTYTSLFGAYSSYLFLRTGHVLGPLLAHAFCNWQGLPAFGRVPGHKHSRALSVAYALGLGAFMALTMLDAIYRPALFGSIFWKES
jgi:prenyl protein peptidase